MRWIAISTVGDNDRRLVQRERFLADVTTRRAMVRLPLLFKYCFYEHVGGYDIFHAMHQIVELSCEPRCIVFIAMEVIRR